MSDLATVLSVGRLYCDLIFTDLPRMPTMGTEVYAGGFGVHAGGGAFITAAHLAALGHPSALSAIPAVASSAPPTPPPMKDRSAAAICAVRSALLAP